MTRYILHIGTHKTGSTTIQAFLAKNRELLGKAGVDIPLYGNGGTKSFLALSDYFRGKNQSTEISEFFKGRDYSYDYTLISAEGFYHCSDKLDLVESFFPEATIVCYYRNPVSHLVSYYKHTVRTLSQIHDLSKFSENCMTNGYYEYENNINKWKARFNVNTGIYTPLSDIELIKNFFRLCGLSVNPAEMISVQNRHLSPSDETTILLMRLNRMKKNRHLDQDTFEKYRKFFTNNDTQIRHLIADKVIRHDYDLGKFVDFFTSQNPSFHFDMNPKVNFPAELEMSDRSILSLM